MTFTATPATPFTAGVSTIPATTANTWRANIAASLDTVGGGAYANVSTIDWSAGSAGWRFYAAVAIKSTGTLTLDAGATVTINADPSLFGTMRVGIGGAGGAVRFYVTSTLTIDDTVACSIAGDVTMTGASTLVHANLSSDTYSAGSVLAINTANATMGQDSVLTVNGTAGHVAQVICDTYSTTTFRTGAGVTCNSGSIFTVGAGCVFTGTIGGGGAAGSLTFGATGELTVPATCTTSMAIGPDGTLSTAAGTIVNLNIGKTNAGTVTNGSLAVEVHEGSSTDTYQSGSNLNLDGTTTRTGSLTLSGNSAWTGLRVITDADPPVETDARHYDILRIDFIAADRVLSLATLGTTTHLIRIRFSATANILRIRESGLAHDLFVFTAVSGSQQTIEMFWSGTAWEVGLVGAMTAI